METIDHENSSLQTILFSSFLFQLENESLPLFPVKKILPKQSKTKITIFHSFIWKHPFLSDSLKSDFLDFFCKLQRTYYGFSRFLRLYKCKKATVAVSTDLFLNPLDPKNKRTCIFFIHKSIYYFNIADIWKLFERAWTNTIGVDFDFELYMPKNPYTNIPFSKSELYHYYFHRVNHGFSIPALLEYMFQEHFVLSSFEIKYEGFISKYMIRKAVFDCPFSIHLFNNAMEMIDENTYTTFWKIDPDFPRERFVDIMRPYLYLYYLINYGKLTGNQYIYYSDYLHKILHLFWKFNILFGKRKIPLRLCSKNTTLDISNSFYDQHLSIQTLHL
jgi:hypothetical protein